MKKYIYQNTLVSKKQLRQLLAWSFKHYNYMQASVLADELKYLGFNYATQAGISISIEDLKVPFMKTAILQKSNQEIEKVEKLYLKGKMSTVERFQKIIDTWGFTSESLKEQVVYYFKNYDPLNSVYIMAFSGARGNLSQVRQLVGMRGLMSDPSGEIMNLPIKKNFREGLSITDYLISGYGARKGIVDTALKTANSGYLTRRLIDVGQDILIREKDCFTSQSFLVFPQKLKYTSQKLFFQKMIGRVLQKPITDFDESTVLAKKNTILTPTLLETLSDQKIEKFYIRSPLTCQLYRAICQNCYGWDLANENLVDMGEAIGILAGQSIGEPGTQLTMRTFHTGGVFTSKTRKQVVSPIAGIVKFSKLLKVMVLRTNRGDEVLVTKTSGSLLLLPENSQETAIQVNLSKNTILFPSNHQYISKNTVIGEVIDTNRQIKIEIKPILSDGSGEIFMPKVKTNRNQLSQSHLIWSLSGQLYNSPTHSFINFYTDRKINYGDSVFRTKIINYHNGWIQWSDDKWTRSERIIQRLTNLYCFHNATLSKLSRPWKHKKYVACFGKSYCFLNLQEKNSRVYLQQSRQQYIGSFVSNFFRTFTGGKVYYDTKNYAQSLMGNKKIRFFDSTAYKLEVTEDERDRFGFYWQYWNEEKKKKKYYSSLAPLYRFVRCLRFLSPPSQMYQEIRKAVTQILESLTMEDRRQLRNTIEEIQEYLNSNEKITRRNPWTIKNNLRILSKRTRENRPKLKAILQNLSISKRIVESENMLEFMTFIHTKEIYDKIHNSLLEDLQTTTKKIEILTNQKRTKENRHESKILREIKKNLIKHLKVLNNENVLTNPIGKRFKKFAKNEEIQNLLKTSLKSKEIQNILKIQENCENLNRPKKTDNREPSVVSFRTLIWRGEEVHKISCESNGLLVQNGDFISEKFELVSGLFSKTSGLVTVHEISPNIQRIVIKSGVLYEIQKWNGNLPKLYYPGEIIFSNVLIRGLSFCEHIVGKTTDQLLVQPVELFECPFLDYNSNFSWQKEHPQNKRVFGSKTVYCYESNQTIHGSQSIDLVSQLLVLKPKAMLDDNKNIELGTNSNRDSITFLMKERVRFKDVLTPNLSYHNLESCFLVQPTQFVDPYAVLGYLQSRASKLIEIVKVKIREKDTKQVFLISNEDCLLLPKSKFLDKKINDFVTDSLIFDELGKIILENQDFYILQKGKPHFFPNCPNEELNNTTTLEYKYFQPNAFSLRLKEEEKKTHEISVTYQNLLKSQFLKEDKNVLCKMEFPKLFLKRNGKLYSSLAPQLYRKFSIGSSKTRDKHDLIKSNQKYQEFKHRRAKFVEKNPRDISDMEKELKRIILLQRFDVIKKNSKSQILQNPQFILAHWSPYSNDSTYPIPNGHEANDLSSITENYFEKELNSIFCINGQFIDNNETIGLLQLEKEITGDIVQGLPKVEEILEARKRKPTPNRIPISHKKSILAQTSSLDTMFEFRKLGTLLQENDKINPHKLLKVYFNYYGLMKKFICEKEKIFKSNRLTENYEGTYKSFKKVQQFILRSVQEVYESQGVSINDKHLEVVIKQMTSKVLITYEGDTSLLRTELIDLHHIHSINQIMTKRKKQVAFYVPFLQGITKSALNNPSFISAASFQETTRVLTKAAIEGRLDWLRGLKENIITGHLIPAGTGYQTYQNSFIPSVSSQKRRTSETSAKEANNPLSTL